MTHRRAVGLAAGIVVLLAACGSSTTDGGQQNEGNSQNDSSEITGASSFPMTIDNQGGSMEGHTPRGFAGTGTGLFVGDNLNPGFPDGDGVQTFLTFELSSGTEGPSSALLESDALDVRGTPFEDLGNINAEPVSYDEFSAQLFDLAPDGPATACARVGETGLECDVSGAVSTAIAEGATRVQFRLYFDVIGDNDGEGDLAMFFSTDSNTNEAGIFTLVLE